MRTEHRLFTSQFVKHVLLELRIFLIDARFETTALFINFILPSALLIIAILTAPQQNLTDEAVTRVIFQFTTYICLTTVMNLVISFLVVSREDGNLLVHTHIFGSPKPYIWGLIVGQSTICAGEALALSVLGMLITKHIHWPIIIAVLIGAPLVTTVLSLFFLPLVLWKATANNSAAVITILLLVLFNTPGKASHPVLSFLLQLNPVYFSQNVQLLLFSPTKMITTTQIIACVAVLLLAAFAGSVTLKKFPLRPLLKRA